MSRIRDRLSETLFQQFFQKIVELCQEHGLVKGKSLMTDATLISANASLDSMMPKDKSTTENTHKIKGLGPPHSKKLSNKTHVSETDPDASLAYKAGTPQSLKYKANVTADSAYRIIVDCHITTGADHESQTYIQRLMHITQAYGWEIEDVTADHAYGSSEILQVLQDKNIKSYIPLFSGRSGTALPTGFVYEASHDRYRCPQGKYLTGRSTDRNIKTRYYQASIEECRVCSIKNTCLKSATHRKRGRILTISPHQLLFEKIAQHMQTFSFTKKLSERFWKMEGLMAEAKNRHGMKRAKYRGRSKVQIQAYLISTVQNIKRLMATIDWFDRLSLTYLQIKHVF